jgi:site-specific recombinase XerD
MSSSLLPTEQSLPLAFGHPLAVIDLESRFLTDCDRDTRAEFRADLDPWFAFCSDFAINVLSAQERHVAGYVRHQTDVEWVDAVTMERRLGTLSVFYDYAVASRAATINPVTTAILAMVDY